jgi:hypothetical protein
VPFIDFFGQPHEAAPFILLVREHEQLALDLDK